MNRLEFLQQASEALNSYCHVDHDKAANFATIRLKEYQQPVIKKDIIAAMEKTPGNWCYDERGGHFYFGGKKKYFKSKGELNDFIEFITD